MVTFSFVGQQC